MNVKFGLLALLALHFNVDAVGKRHFPSMKREKSTQLKRLQQMKKFCHMLSFLVLPAFSTEKKSGCCQRFQAKFYRKDNDQEKLLQEKAEKENRLIQTRIEEEKRRDFLFAVKWGDTEAVKILATQNVDLNRADDNGQTPVWIAAWKGHAETVKFLATQNVDLNRADNNGQTPVWVAAAQGYTEIVKFLATQNVDLNQADDIGRTPVEMATQGCHMEIVTFLTDSVNLEENLLSSTATEEISQMIPAELKKK